MSFKSFCMQIKCLCCFLGLLGTDLHRIHWQSELSSGRPGGQPLHMLRSSGWRFSGQTLLNQKIPHLSWPRPLWTLETRKVSLVEAWDVVSCIVFIGDLRSRSFKGHPLIFVESNNITTFRSHEHPRFYLCLSYFIGQLWSNLPSKCVFS